MRGSAVGELDKSIIESVVESTVDSHHRREPKVCAIPWDPPGRWAAAAGRAAARSCRAHSGAAHAAGTALASLPRYSVPR